MAFYLAIVSPLDAPLYETSFASSKPSSSGSTSSPSSSFPSWSSFTTSSASSTNGDETTPASAKLGGQLGLISNSGGPALERHLAQMVAFAALDSVDEVVETTGSL